MDRPACSSSRRVSGRPMPITDDGSPSTLSMNQPPRPSSVKPPATEVGSPLSTYAPRSAGGGPSRLPSVGVDEGAGGLMVLPRTGIRHSLVYTCPEFPTISPHPPRAAAAD